VRTSEHNRIVWTQNGSFLALEKAFHGRTLGASCLTAGDEQLAVTSGGAIGVIRIGPHDIMKLGETVKECITDIVEVRDDGKGALKLLQKNWCRIIGVIVEPVQGEGGINVLDSSFAAALRLQADAFGCPVTIDEIQAGLGRCGSFTAAEQLDLIGDYYLFAKSLGGGVAKISALSVERGRYQEKFDLFHTSTFGEEDLSANVVLEALRIDRDRIAERCQDIGRHLTLSLSQLRAKYPSVIEDVRGLGCMIGIELKDQSQSEAAIMRMAADDIGYLAAGYLLNEEGVRVLPAGSAPRTLRLEPSAYMCEADRNICVEGIARLCQVIENANAGRLLRHLVHPTASVVASPIRDWRGCHHRRSAVPRVADAKVAFLMHLVDAADLLFFDPSLGEIDSECLRDLVCVVYRVLKPRIMQEYIVESVTGRTVQLSIIGFVVTAELIENALLVGDLGWLNSQIEYALQLAKNCECSFVGFGGHLSIGTANCQSVASPELMITSGNALTVGVTLEAVIRTCEERGIKLQEARVGVIGASGNIGSVLCELLAKEVAHLVLIGRDSSMPALRRTAEQLVAASPDDALIHYVNPAEGVAVGTMNKRDLGGLSQFLGIPGNDALP
jgi:acetylornithine/succinyldiaminopimelate/putrescine aminotransferase